MFRTIVAQIAVAQSAQEHASRAEQPCPPDLMAVCPPRRTIGGDKMGLAGTYERTHNRKTAGSETTQGRDGACFIEKSGGVSLVGVPPFEQAPRHVKWQMEEFEPRRAKSGLKPQMPRRPFRGKPHSAERGREHDRDLPDKNFCWRHGCFPRESGNIQRQLRRNLRYLSACQQMPLQGTNCGEYRRAVAYSRFGTACSAAV